MPKFRVKSNISYGVTQNGRDIVKTFGIGDTIELTTAEAYELRHALVNPPHAATVEKMTKEEKAAYDSAVANPDHHESGVTLDWKVDSAAREAAVRNQAILASSIQPTNSGTNSQPQAGSQGSSSNPAVANPQPQAAAGATKPSVGASTASAQATTGNPEGASDKK